ncbi:MAG: TOBE domain-containing protein [Flavobacteriaceae bacterium]|nr:TOBE domain-containing protein [Bacteroidia bacterium]MBT8288368.1 TOBE domain-containing protein [Bacteroidia bacterium]NNF75285.1 TOBE domain-containing protein [Flavobacteriaceae bacterium]NNK72108.1 TOBE domain-containing protein [Flavobacteriaceae bacterium]
MNKINGHIENIEVCDGLSIASVRADANLLLKAIVIETPETVPYLKIGHKITLVFKETEVIIATGDVLSISLQNKIPASIQNLTIGKLLCRLELNTSVGKVVSIISSNAVKQLGLTKGTSVTAMIKLNEVMLSEI